MKNNKNLLTEKQRKVLESIRSLTDEHNEAPTISELRDRFNPDASLRSIAQHVEALEKKGFIKRDRYKRRNIRIIGDLDANSSTVLLPVIASVGCDAGNVFAQQEYDEYIPVDKSFVKEGDTMVAIRAVGDSMNDSGIEDGDYVLVKATEDVKDGDRVVAIIDGMALVKRIRFTEKAVILNPESRDTNYKPIVMREDFKVFGKVVDIIPVDSNIDEERRYEKIKENENDYN